MRDLFVVYEPTVVERDKQTSETAAARIAARTPLEAALRSLLPDIQAESGNDLTKLLTTNIPLGRVRFDVFIGHSGEAAESRRWVRSSS